MLKKRDVLANGKNDIFEAARAGDVAKLKKLLWAWGIPDFADSQGATPLHHAAANGFVEGIQLLLKHKAKISARDLTGATPLHWAARARCEASVNELVNAGADIKAVDYLGLAPFEPTPPDIPGALSRKRRERRKVRLRASLIGLVVALFVGGIAYFIASAVVHRADLMYILASRGEVDALRLFISVGVDPNMETRFEKTVIEGAIEGDSVEALEVLLEAGAKYPIQNANFAVLPRSFYLPTLLHLAADQCAPECTEYLLGKYPEMARQLSSDGCTPLHCLNSGMRSVVREPSEEDTRKVLQLLLAAGLEVDDRSRSETTPLHFACHRGDSVMASLLIQAGADVNAIDWSGWTPLMMMYGRDSYNEPPSDLERRAPTVKVLLAAGADPNTVSEIGETALHKLVSGGYSEAALLVIEAGADVNARDNKGNTPLLAIRYPADIECVRHLIRAGADVNARNNEGLTALHTAVTASSPAMLDALVAGGADISVSSFGGRYLLHLAASSGSDAVVGRLLSLGLAVDARDENGLTPLHYAAEKSLECVRALIAGGADVNAQDKRSRTPLLHMLKESREADLDIVKYLVESGADVNHADHIGITALHVAAGEGLSDVISFLIEEGADRAAKDVHGAIPRDLATGMARHYRDMLSPVEP